MFRTTRKRRPETACPSLAYAPWTGAMMLCLAAALGPPGRAHADDERVKRTAQAMPPHGGSGHPVPGQQAPDRPRAAPDPTSARLLAPVPAGIPVTALGLTDFERIALERNPTLRQAAAQVDGAANRSLQAGLYPNPTIGYIQEQIGALGEVRPTPSGIVASRKSTPGELVGGFVQQEIITGGKLRLSRAKFAEEANAARWQSVAQQFRVLNGVRTRYFEVVAAQRLIQVHRELVRLNEDAVRTTEELTNVGQANEPDLLQARVESRRTRVALRNAENRYKGHWEALVSLVGAPELRPTPLDERLLETEAGPLDFDATLADLKSRSPEIQAALAEIRRDQIMVQRERVEPIPNLTVQAIVGRNYEFNITTAGVQLSAPIPVFNRNQGTRREAESDLARDRAEYDRIALSLRLRLADVATRYDDALQSVQDFRAETLPLARRAYEVLLANFRARRAAWPQVLVAQRTFTELNKEYVQSLLELRRAEVEIGTMLLVDGLGAPGTPTSQGHIEAVPTPR